MKKIRAVTLATCLALSVFSAAPAIAVDNDDIIEIQLCSHFQKMLNYILYGQYVC